MGIGLADVLVKGNCHAVVLGLSGLGMAREIACAPVLLIWAQSLVKPVAVRIAFKAMYDINASVHVSPPSRRPETFV